MSPANSQRRTGLLFGAIVAVMVVVLAAVLFNRLSGPMESSWAYEQGLALAGADPRVLERLGEPLEFGRVEGGVRVSGETGDAELTIPLRGSRGQGSLQLVARKRYDRWRFERAEVRGPGDGRIDLLNAGAAGGP